MDGLLTVEHDVVIDETHWPIVRATWPETTTDAALERYMAFVIERLHRGERFAIGVDGRIATRRPGAQHKPVAAELTDQRGLVASLIVRARVIAHPLARLSLSAINSLFPPPFPQRVFGNTDDAIRWAELVVSNGATKR